jgi:hypothetical protein
MGITFKENCPQVIIEIHKYNIDLMLKNLKLSENLIVDNV